MSPVQNVWRQLVQRRLWPVAIVLIAGLAAVPLTLAKDPDPVVAPPVTADTGDSELATQPIVAQAAPEDRAKPRHVLGKPKNPFAKPKPVDSTLPKDNASSTVLKTATEESQNESSSGGASTPAGGGSLPSGGAGTPAPSTPVTTPKPAPKTYALHELTVRFGSSESGGARQSLERLQPLPSAEEPVLIYLGVLKDGKTAVFLVDHGVSAVGDGDCRPAPDTCETLRMRAGETEFLDVTDAAGAVTAQYQLDLLKIHKGKTASASRAKASSKAGQRLLKARVAGDGPTGYRWDASSGALERKPGHALRATFGSATVALP